MCSYLMKLNKTIRSLQSLVNRTEHGKNNFALRMYDSFNVYVLGNGCKCAKAVLRSYKKMNSAMDCLGIFSLDQS
jgi:hypothetical protein